MLNRKPKRQPLQGSDLRLQRWTRRQPILSAGTIAFFAGLLGWSRLENPIAGVGVALLSWLVLAFVFYRDR